MIPESLQPILNGKFAEKLMTTQQYVSELERQEHINVEKINRILNVLNSNREEWDKFRRLLPISK